MTQSAIHILAADYDRLSSLAESAASRTPQTANFLQQELDRAQIVSNPGVAAVQMGSRVRYRDHTSEREQEVQLVYPAESDMSQGRISVMTPIGAALIGLVEGASIAFRDHTGMEKTLTVLEVN